MISPLRVRTGLLALVLAIAAPLARAEDDPRAVPLFNADHGIADLLAVAQERKKALIVVVRGGKTYTGFVKSVGAHAVILTRLQGKEFFDAYVPLGSIVAMEERVRLR